MPQHVHQAHRHARIGYHRYRARRVQGIHVIDHPGTGRDRLAHQLRLTGVNRNGDIQFGTNALNHRQHPGHLFVQRYRRSPRAGGLAADIKDVGTLRQHTFCLPQRGIDSGKTPTVESVKMQCAKIRSRPYMKRLITVEVMPGQDDVPELDYAIDNDAVHELSQTYLGKNILITSRQAWDDEKIIRAYRSQYLIEDVFKEMKDRTTGTWWPLGHWTNSKIQVHGLYCTMALLIRATLLRRVRQGGPMISLKRLLSELDGIREVVNIYPRKRRQKTQRKQAVLTKTSELQKELLAILGLKQGENGSLG